MTVLKSESHAMKDGHCVHLLAPPPATLHLAAEVVAALNFQPRYCPAPGPCIASRRGDVLTIGFHTIGLTSNVSHCQHGLTRHHYRLTPSSTDGVLVGTEISEQEATA